jgi:hypothetical protein
LALLGLAYTRSFDRLRGIAWITPIIGAWVIAAPWVTRQGSGIAPAGVAAGPSLSSAAWTGNMVAGAIATIAGVVLTVVAVRSKSDQS